MKTKSKIVIEFLQWLNGFGFLIPSTDEYKVFHLNTNAFLSAYIEEHKYDNEDELNDDENELFDSDLIVIESGNNRLEVSYKDVIDFYLVSFAQIKANIEDSDPHIEFKQMREHLEHKFEEHEYEAEELDL